MYKTIITLPSFCCLALLCCLALPAAAADVQLQENHPDRYTVVKGDTLWGIAGKFLKDPWQWPKVWKMNRAEIKNPHRIYPGDTIVLDMSSGSPELHLVHGTVTLEPGIRVEELEKAAVPTISLYIISPFLSQPLVIENEQLDNTPVIIGGPENRVVLSPGVKIYVDGIKEDEGAFWQVYRDGKVLTDAVTKEVLGTEAYYLGDAQVSAYGEPASAEIIRAKEEIFKGDRLIAAPEESTASFVPRAPDDQITGSIISIYGGVGETASNAIVTIDRGSSDGLAEGHVLAIYREGKVVRAQPATKGEHLPHYWEESKNTPYQWDNPDSNTTNAPDKKSEEIAMEKDPTLTKLPSERVGLVMIFRTFERVSYALVVQASEPINVLDLVQTP